MKIVRTVIVGILPIWVVGVVMEGVHIVEVAVMEVEEELIGRSMEMVQVEVVEVVEAMVLVMGQVTKNVGMTDTMVGMIRETEVIRVIMVADTGPGQDRLEGEHRESFIPESVDYAKPMQGN